MEFNVFMLNRLLELRWPITAVLSDEQVTKRKDRILHLRSVLAEELVKALRPFKVATTFFSYQENTSCVLSGLYGLLDHLEKDTDTDTVVLQFITSFNRQ